MIKLTTQPILILFISFYEIGHSLTEPIKLHMRIESCKKEEDKKLLLTGTLRVN